MQDERNDMTVAASEWVEDRTVIDLLLNSDQRIWSIDEVGREVGHPVQDEVGRLYGAGLIHRIPGGFVMLTRAAMKALDLAS